MSFCTAHFHFSAATDKQKTKGAAIDKKEKKIKVAVSAILKRAGVETKIKRPRGSRGRELAGWLWPERPKGYSKQRTRWT